MSLPYNHVDPVDRRRPLPLRVRTLPRLGESQLSQLTSTVASLQTTSAAPIRIRLRTDSAHLARFFSSNWPTCAAQEAECDAEIIARSGPASQYALDDDWEEARWYCPASRQVWTLGSNYYGNLKITVRGLCSELAPQDEMFAHGCAMSFESRGMLLSGTSGSGKTTITGAMRSLARNSVRVVNDDWGPLSLSTRRVRFTGEPLLHMKYPSVRTIAPLFVPTPATHMSENYCGDPMDPHARLLVSREEVFGVDGVVDEVELGLFVLVRREPDRAVGLRELKPSDGGLLERGSYSAFYHRTERFLNGSLFLLRLDEQRRLHRRLLESMRCVAVNNVGPAERTADLILETLHATNVAGR
jgi:hypothetical protein